MKFRFIVFLFYILYSIFYTSPTPVYADAKQANAECTAGDTCVQTNYDCIPENPGLIHAGGRSIFRCLPIRAGANDNCDPNGPPDGALCIPPLICNLSTYTCQTAGAAASTPPAPPTGSCDPNKPGDCPAGLAQIEQVVGNVVTVSVGLSFIALLVLLVVAGIKYMTSGGDQKAISSAHQTVSWAVLGVLFLAGAWVVLQLLALFTGIDALKVFDIRRLCLVAGNPTNWCTP